MKPALAALLVFLLCAANAGAQVKNPGVFIHLTTSDMAGLDPDWVYDTQSHMVIANVYEFLFAWKGSSLREMEPRIASQVPSLKNGLVSKDGLKYVIPIRKGIKFHEGQALTPADVKYSLLRFMLVDRAGGPSGLLLEPILGVSSTRDAQGRLLPGIFQKADKAVSVSGDKVVIRLPKPFAPFLTILASFGGVLSKSWCVGLGDWDGSEAGLAAHNNVDRAHSPLMERSNGTGPFLLSRWEKRSKEVVLDRFDGYWRKPAALKRVIVRGIDEFATRKLMLQAGDADSIYGPQPMFGQLQGLAGVRMIDDLELLEGPTTLAFTFHINPSGNPNIGSGKLDGEGIPPDFFADKDVRKAFAYSIDYDSFIKDVLRGKARTAHGIIPKGLLGYLEKPSPYRFDPDLARKHFQKAWGGKVWENGFHLTLVFTSGVPPFQTLIEMIKRNVEALNPKFKIDVRPIQWSTFLEQSQSHKIPAFVALWLADYPDPHNFAAPYLRSGNYFPSKQDYRNAELDALIDQAASTLDPVKREAQYRRIQEIALDELPQIPIETTLRYRVERQWVKGWFLRPIFPDAPYGDYYYDLSKEDSK